jgi:hypothetical protein
MTPTLVGWRQLAWVKTASFSWFLRERLMRAKLGMLKMVNTTEAMIMADARA